MSAVDLRPGGATHVGLVREVNEDAYLLAPPLFVVADGMGGHDRGDVASRIVVDEFAALAERGYDPADGVEAVDDTLRRCRAGIAAYDAEQHDRGRRGFAAGTTAVVALLAEAEGEPVWLVANLGDSRAYRLAGGRLAQVSVDHSLVQQLLDAGRITPAEAAVHPERHVITRALGGRGSVEADYVVLPLARAGRLLLCSDGVSGMIDDASIERILLATPDPAEAADRLVAAAVTAGGRDNATAVVVDVAGA